MPELSTFDWMLICTVGMILSGLATFFFKDVFKKNDKQSDDIQEIQKDYAPRSELTSAASSLRNDHKSVSERLAANERALHHIRETYATKAEAKELRAELRDEIKALSTELRDESKTLSKDVADIKANYLTKDDWYRKQVEVDRKLDDIYKLLVSERRSPNNVK